MDLIDNIKELSIKAKKQIAHIETEEATKNAIIMPFLAALGYDVFNPLEVIPEVTADIGRKKGEKVDYAIKKDGKVIILVDCKRTGDTLDAAHAWQLARYFSVTESRFGILTNGMQY
uniref:Type I restriction enzyme R protein N terminus (HSDR_N) n=1 Tax=Candidatus Kentrum sp. LPFa TaxID=2126335 RepID=A0A450WG19_9GAMM|nr:MAG: Type I restriction enzyme R protein N terminus (HSDR_N) [Candidatus Kentron sp. LPFa]VFK31428.1 MAG: Type I restriction enzyme R protein N terminus (HSDR_N) [Candidatus Kentron sp. LPFa]